MESNSDGASGFRFLGNGTDLFLLTLKNTILTIITLGIYLPWAKTEVRKFIWANSSFDGHRFSYEGTGMEIFQGYIKLIALVVGVFALNSFLPPTGGVIVNVLFYLLFIILLPHIIYGSHKYKASRTKLRGVRFSVDSTKKNAFVTKFYIDVLLTAITFGFYAPVLIFHVHKRLISDTRFGNQPFSQNAEPGPDWWITISNYLLIYITVGIFLPWAIARKARYRICNIEFMENKFGTTVTGFGVFKTLLLGGLATVLSFGLLAPWATTMLLKYSLENLNIEGQVDYKAIQASIQESNATSDVASDVLDLDLGIL